MAAQKYRVIILGAGFSKPAGLPLGDELWVEILNPTSWFFVLKRCKKGQFRMLASVISIGYAI